MKKSHIILGACSLVQAILLCFLAAYNFELKVIVVSIVYFLETYFLLRYAGNNKERRIIILLMALPPLVIFIPGHIISFKATLFGLPSTVAYFFGIGLGMLVYYANRVYFKVIYSALFAISILFVYIRGYEMWSNKMNYGNFLGEVKEPIIDYSIIDANGKSFSKAIMKDNLVVLDFWTTSCGVCFSEFPAYQKMINDYSAYKNVKFYTANIPSPHDSLHYAEKMLKERGYNFTNYYIPQKDALSKFKVQFVPTAIILLNGNEVVYRGDASGVGRYIKDHVRKAE